MRHIVNTLLLTDSSYSDSLDAIQNPADEDAAFVQATNRWYRYFSASTVTPDGALVVIPFGQSTSVAGRWFVQGRPGPAAVIPSKPADLSSDAKLAKIWIQVQPIYASSVQTRRFDQDAKAPQSISDITCAVANREEFRVGNTLTLVAADEGPILWTGIGGIAGYSILRCTFNASLINDGIDQVSPYWFGFRTGGSTPRGAKAVYLNSTHDARQSICVVTELLVQNGGQPASQVWPVWSGDAEVTLGQLEWTEMFIGVEDTGIRI